MTGRRTTTTTTMIKILIKIIIINRINPLYVDFAVNTLKVFPILSLSVRNWLKR